MKPRPAFRFAWPSFALALGVLLFTACTPIYQPVPWTPTGAMGPSGPPPPPPSPPPPPPPVIVAPLPPSTYVVFFSEPNYRGDSFTIEAGAGVENLSRLSGIRGSWNDRISSFRIEGIATVVAFADANFRGERLETSSSLGDLVAERRGGGGANWEHAISSLRVVATRGNAVEPEPHYDARTAENIVRRAYRDILFRDPEPEGLRSHRDKLMNGTMTEDDLRTTLQRSPEHRAINFDEIITRAYREVLKREPDPEGLKHYHQLMADRGWTEPELRADLLRSTEHSGR